MRIPYAKVYRAFPELDRFTDADCERFVQTSRERFGMAMMGGAALAVLAFLVVGPVFGFIWFGLVSAIAEEFRLGSAFEDTWLPILWVIVGVCGIPFSGAVAALFVRDRVLIGVITRQLMSANCAACGYSLLGLPVEKGAVVCPECGVASNLADRGLTAGDIISGTEPRPSGSGDESRAS